MGNSRAGTAGKGLPRVSESEKQKLTRPYRFSEERGENR
jgi:hypothetical protein